MDFQKPFGSITIHDSQIGVFKKSLFGKRVVGGKIFSCQRELCIQTVCMDNFRRGHNFRGFRPSSWDFVDQ